MLRQLRIPRPCELQITGIQKVKEGDVAVKFNGGSDTYSMDEDCVYIAVNDDKQEGMEGSSLDQISLAEETSTAGQYYAKCLDRSGEE